MNKTQITTIAVIAVVLAVFGGIALAQQDKYTVRVPGGLAFSEFRGYEGWQVVAISQNDKLVAVIVANPVMIDAYLAGIPANGKPFPDGATFWKNAATTCGGVPTPPLPADALSGLAFSQAIRPFRLSAGIAFFARIKLGLLTSSAIGSKSSNRSYRSESHQSRQIRSLDWQTLLAGNIGRQRIFPPVANL